MARFRLMAIVTLMLVVALTATDLNGKGSKGGGGHKGGGHKAAPHRPAPKVHSAHHSGPKPNRVAHKSAPHHANHPNKHAHHSPKSKGPVKVAKSPDKHKESPKKDAGKKDHGKKDSGKKDPNKKNPGKKGSGKKGPGKESGKPATPTHNPKTPGKRPLDHKEAHKRPDDKHRERDRRFVGRRHAAVHHLRTSTITITGTRRSALVAQLHRLPELMRRRPGHAGGLLRGRRRARSVGEL